MVETFKDVFEAHAGKGSDKWASYLDVYEGVFREYRDRPVSLLEIGVQNGGSLEIYARYFPQLAIAIGCDINPHCGSLRYPDPIKVLVGDGNAPAMKQQVQALCPAFDLIIDDGSHTSPDIIKAFLNYYPVLKPGGAFILEDLHACYWRSHGGGLQHPESAMAFLKDLADLTNFEHWGVPASRQAFLAARHPRYAGLIAACDLDNLLSVTFTNSVCVVRKAAAGSTGALGPRIVVGREFAISRDPLEVAGRTMPPADERANPYASIDRSLAGRIAFALRNWQRKMARPRRT